MIEDEDEEILTEDIPPESRTRWSRRKQTWKKIQRSFRISVKGEARKGGGLGKKRDVQMHRLYKGPNWNNRGGYAHNTKNLGPSNRDRRADADCAEQINLMQRGTIEEKGGTDEIS